MPIGGLFTMLFAAGHVGISFHLCRELPLHFPLFLQSGVDHMDFSCMVTVPRLEITAGKSWAESLAGLH